MVSAVKIGKREAAALWRRAFAAGLAAGKAALPAPMVVYEADGLSGDPKPEGKSWNVSEGVCGFAWVIVKPGTSSFARWLVKNGYARKSYYGGVDVWVSAFGQSYDRKIAAASAIAEVFREAGIKAYADGRLD